MLSLVHRAYIATLPSTKASGMRSYLGRGGRASYRRCSDDRRARLSVSIDQDLQPEP